MMKKIAVIGANNQDNLILTQAFSYLTGYSVVNKTDYSIQAIRYGLSNELRNNNWQELFIYVLSSFSERIIIEQHYDRYVSNGSVLYDFALAKVYFNLRYGNNKRYREQVSVLAGMEKIITEYASRQYDGFIYVNRHLEKEIALINEIDTCIENLIAGQKSIYRIRKDSILSDMLEKIWHGFSIYIENNKK
jgi:hypothetical protein